MAIFLGPPRRPKRVQVTQFTAPVGPRKLSDIFTPVGQQIQPVSKQLQGPATQLTAGKQFITVSGQGSLPNVGAFKQIIPVEMFSQEQADVGPAVFEPDTGSRWGTPSQFNFSAANPPLTGDNSPVGQGGQGEVWDDEETRHVYKVETLINEVPDARKKGTRVIVTGGTIIDSPSAAEFTARPKPPIRQELTTQVKADLGVESRQEVIGFTITQDGSLQERYQEYAVQRYLLIDINKP